MPKLTLPERFLLCRHRMRITQQALASLLRVSRKTVSTLENGGTIEPATIERFLILEQRYIDKLKEERKNRRLKGQSNANSRTGD
jgi:transcriptional regulator with XRE-family HTH domain